MKRLQLSAVLLFGIFLPLTGHSQQFIKGIEFGAQTAVPHYFSWGQYGEEEIDLLRPYLQSTLNSYAGGFLEKKLNAVLSLRAGLLVHQVSFRRGSATGEVPNALNQIHLDNRYNRKSTRHRIGVPISLKAAISPRITIGVGGHMSRTFLSTGSWGELFLPIGNSRRIPFGHQFIQIHDLHLASFMSASYQLMDLSSPPLFLTITGEYDHKWSMPAFNGINYRLIRLAMGMEWRFE